MSNILKVSIGIFMSTFLLQLVVCNRMSVKTQELNQLGQEVARIQSQISVSNQQLYLTSSITGLEEKAKSLGFSSMSSSVKRASSPTIASAL